MAKQPIRVFFSPLTHRFYATRGYRLLGDGRVQVTGNKEDVTEDIAALVVQNQLTFREIAEAPEPAARYRVEKGAQHVAA